MRILFILILCSTVKWLCGQELSHKQYTVKDGLPGSIVYHSLQDKDGFIWFATNQGASRFDGRTFKNFSKEDGLPDNEILKLYLDRNNHIWFISLTGVPSVYYNGKISKIDSCPGVIAILEDQLTDSIFFISAYYQDGRQYYGYYQSPNIPGQWHFRAHLRVIQGPQTLFQWPILKESSPEGINFYYTIKNAKDGEVLIKTTGSEKTYPVKNMFNPGIAPFNRQFFSTLS